jgi:hypothetical protein
VENLLRCGTRGNVVVIDENHHTDDLRRKTHVARHDDHRPSSFGVDGEVLHHCIYSVVALPSIQNYGLP